MTRSRQTADWGSRAGLAKIIPSSVAVGSGTGSADSLGNVTFSGASSVSLNGVFSSNYDYYKMTIDAKTASGSASISARLRTGGTDATAGNYNRQWLNAGGTSVSASNSVNATSWDIFVYTVDATVSYATNIEIANVAKALPTTAVLTHTRFYDSSIAFNGLAFGHTLSTAYDGITLITSASTISGTVRVYGYTQ